MSYYLMSAAPAPAPDTKPHASRVYPGDPEYDRIMNMVRQIDEADEDDVAPGPATQGTAKSSFVDQVADEIERMTGRAESPPTTLVTEPVRHAAAQTKHDTSDMRGAIADAMAELPHLARFTLERPE